MRKRQPNTFDSKYFVKFSDGQRAIAGALKDYFEPISAVTNQATLDGFHTVKGTARWEKLVVLKIAEINLSNKSQVEIKRGENWQAYWDKFGVETTKLQDDTNDLSNNLSATLSSDQIFESSHRK